jgi:hypothetical protein
LRKLHNELIFAVSTVLIFFLLFVDMLSLTDALSTRWHAGYFYAGTEIMAPWGVNGKIYNLYYKPPSSGIDNNVSVGHGNFIIYLWLLAAGGLR